MLTGFRDAVEEGVDPLHVVFGIEAKSLGIPGGSVVHLVVLFTHLRIALIINWMKQNLVRFYFKLISLFIILLFSLPRSLFIHVSI